MNRPEAKPKLGIGYSKETKAGDPYINITINLELLAAVIATAGPGEKSIKVGLFQNQTEFRKETTPDYNLVHLTINKDSVKQPVQKAAGAVSNGQTKKSNFPF